jgi:hypothetical protein
MPAVNDPARKTVSPGWTPSAASRGHLSMRVSLRFQETLQIMAQVRESFTKMHEPLAFSCPLTAFDLSLSPPWRRQVFLLVQGVHVRDPGGLEPGTPWRFTPEDTAPQIAEPPSNSGRSRRETLRSAVHTARLTIGHDGDNIETVSYRYCAKEYEEPDERE